MPKMKTKKAASKRFKVRSGIDTSNPQTAEYTFLVAAIAVCLLTGTHNCLLSDTINIIAAKGKALGQRKYFLMTGTSRYTTFYSGHLILSSKLSVRHHRADFFFIRLADG